MPKVSLVTARVPLLPTLVPSLALVMELATPKMELVPVLMAGLVLLVTSVLSKWLATIVVLILLLAPRVPLGLLVLNLASVVRPSA